MIRLILLFVLFLVIYHALKTVIRSAMDAYHRSESERKLPGEEMVLDPSCRTYVVKGRSVMRRISGNPTYFCSTDCADRYEQRQ